MGCLNSDLKFFKFPLWLCLTFLGLSYFSFSLNCFFLDDREAFASSQIKRGGKNQRKLTRRSSLERKNEIQKKRDRRFLTHKRTHDGLSSLERVKITDLEKKLEKNPKDLKLRLKLGAYLISVEKFKKVIQLLSPYINELDFFTLKLLEKAYEKEKDAKGQVQILELLTLRFKDQPQHELFFRKGQVLMKMKEEDLKLKIKNENQAVKDFRKSIELNPKYEPPYGALIDFFKKKGNFYEALLVLKDKGMELGKDSLYYALLCELYSKRKVKIDTIESCEKAISFLPRRPELYFYQIKAYQDGGEPMVAKKILMELIRKFPEDHLVHEKVGKLYLEEKKYALSYQHLLKATQIKPSALDSQLALAQSAFELGKYEVSLRAFLTVCQLSNKIPLEFKLASSRLRQNQINKDLAHTFSLNLQKCRDRKKDKSSKIVIERFESEKNFINIQEKKDKSNKFNEK